MDEAISSKLLVISLIFMSVVIGFLSIHFFGNDNQVEEMAEQIIEHLSGVDVDLSEGEE